MLFWLSAAGLLLGTLAFLVAPLLRPSRPVQERSRYEAAIYRDQLVELDRDLDRGLIDATEAQAARTEVSRRLLSARQDTAAALAAGTVQARRSVFPLAGIAVGLSLPLVAVGLYLQLGTPDAWERTGPATAGREDLAAQHQVAEMGSAVARLAERLQQNPEDRDGWILLARSYTTMRRFAEAAAAYETALGLAPGDSEVQSAYGEALVLAAGGSVSPRARQAFEAVLSSRPGDPRSRYYLGVAEAQAGRGAEAIGIWQALQADSPPDAPWLPALRQQIAQTAERFDIAVAPQQPPGAVRPGPDAEDLQSAAAMPAAAQDEMIRGMVARLAERLESEPGDLEGWLQLARSYQVLGEPEQLREALDGAAAAAAAQGSSEAQRRVESARQSLLAHAGPATGGAPAAVSVPAAEQAELAERVARLAARLETAPEDVAAWLQLGRAYALLGEPAEARSAYAEALSRQPGNLALLQGYADSTLETGAVGALTPLPDDALTLLRNLLAVDAGNPQALWLLGLAEADAGRPQAAAAHWRQLLGGLPPDDDRFRAVSLQLDRLEAR